MALRYSDFVDYKKLDPVKQQAMKIFEPTLRYPERLGIKVVPESLGQTAPIFDLSGIGNLDFLLVSNIEGLGTKNLVADNMYNEIIEKKKIAESMDVRRLYRGIGQDTVAMAVNDITGVGGDPFTYQDIIACGNSSWFKDEQKTKELLLGYRQAADIGKFAVPQGETPELPDIVERGTLDLAGAAQGIIIPKERFVTGSKLKEDDMIYGISSSGIHSNGLSKARKIAEKLPEGYFTKISNGKTLGEELLTPTPIYAPTIMKVFDKMVVDYLQPITGHGMKKIMRAKKPFTYVIENLPETPIIFQELIEKGEQTGFDVSDKENFQVWNMGIGFVVYGPEVDVDYLNKSIGKVSNLDFFKLGHIEAGDKKVVIKPKNIIYTE